MVITTYSILFCRTWAKKWYDDKLNGGKGNIVMENTAEYNRERYNYATPKVKITFFKLLYHFLGVL